MWISTVEARRGEGAMGEVARDRLVGGLMLRWSPPPPPGLVDEKVGGGERPDGENAEEGEDDSIPSGTVPLDAGPNPVYEAAMRLRASESWDLVVGWGAEVRETRARDEEEMGEGRKEEEPRVRGAERVGRLSMRLTKAASSASASRALLAAERMLC